jgi:hexosaminidase
VAAALTLRTTHQAAAATGGGDGGDPAAAGAGIGNGNGNLELVLESDSPLPRGWRLALTSVLPLAPPAPVRLARRVGTYHELAPADGEGACPSWTVHGVAVGHRPRHANDGPVAAFVILPDGSTLDVDVRPMTRAGDAVRGPAATAAPVASDTALVPMPRRVDVDPGMPLVHRQLRLSPDAIPDADAAWRAVAALAGRLLDESPLGDAGSLEVAARADGALGSAAYRIQVDGDAAVVTASGADGFRHAFVTLAQWAVDGLPAAALVDDHPQWSWRGLHVDLARRWYEPATVERIIDLAAWRKLDRLHLHLTDDEAWRFPVPGWPELVTIGATRGHGLALPPMLGSGASPYGRAYTPAEIAGWVDRAGALGIVLVPEVDVPGHCHAALVARPDLRDPDDTSGAASVQGFVDNVLVPGAPRTAAFLADVIDALAALFPTSPWLHVGGDEVPHGAWQASPIVAAHRVARGLATTRDVEADFHRELVALVASRTGRAVGAWQEAAMSGGVRPGDGYAVGWTSPQAARELAAAGHDVVVSPGQAYYLDMASGSSWDEPGMSWAGTVTFEDTCAFEPGAGWTEAERAHLLGVQACVWSEHVADAATFDRLVFPRLDAVAERAWTGGIQDGAASLRARAERLPRLTVNGRRSGA